MYSPGTTGLVVAVQRRGAGHRAQPGPQLRVQEGQPAQVGPVAGGRDDMVGGQLGPLPGGVGDGQPDPVAARPPPRPGRGRPGSGTRPPPGRAASWLRPGRARSGPGRSGWTPAGAGTGRAAGSRTRCSSRSPAPASGSRSRCSSGRSGPAAAPFHTTCCLRTIPDLGAALVQQGRGFQRRLAGADDQHALAAERGQVGVRGAVRARRRGQPGQLGRAGRRSARRRRRARPGGRGRCRRRPG